MKTVLELRISREDTFETSTPQYTMSIFDTANTKSILSAMLTRDLSNGEIAVDHFERGNGVPDTTSDEALSQWAIDILRNVPL